MRDNDVSVKKSSVFSRMFGAVHRAALRCVAITAIAVTSLFTFDIKPADAALPQSGVTFNVKTTTANQRVTMKFRVTGSLNIYTSGVCYLNSVDGDEVTYLEVNVSSQKTVVCEFPYADPEHTITLSGSNITAYATHSSLTSAPTATNKSVFYFYSGNDLITGISGHMGDVFYTLGNGTSDGQQPRFIDTFKNCTKLQLHASNDGSSNVDLFSSVVNANHPNGIFGTAATWMFAGTFYGCSELDVPFRKSGGSTPGFFLLLKPAVGMFYRTFYNCTSLTFDSATVQTGGNTYVLQKNMFADMGKTSPSSSEKAVPAARMFYQTFYGCTSITSLPADVFSQFSAVNSDTPTAPEYLFYRTFMQCTGLISISENVFGTTINGGYGTASMFEDTFRNCSSLQTIPAALFPTLSSLANKIFSYTFAYCTSLHTITAGVFNRVSGGGGTFAFYYTFAGCSSLTSVGKLFYDRTVSAPTMANNMFERTFTQCSNLVNLPAGLFDLVSNSAATYVFSYTFYGCTKLGNSTATGNNGIKDIFNSVGSTGVDYMFNYTFSGCTGLKKVPANLFNSFTAASGRYMFSHTFDGCTGITTIEKIFGTGSGKRLNNYIFTYMFNGCNNQSLTTLPSNLFKPFSVSNSSAKYVFDHTFYGCTGLTTLGDTVSNNVRVSVFAGMGATPGESMFVHTFSGCTGLVTLPARLFSAFTGTGSTRMFDHTFYGCSNLTDITDVFAGMGATPGSYMFVYTFGNCTSLATLPAGLFGAFTGAPAEYMFNFTFNGCTSLQRLTTDIFGNAGSGGNVPAASMFEAMFYNCSGIVEVMGGFFARYTGTPAQRMFANTFQGCSSLTTITNIFQSVGSASATKVLPFGMFSFTFADCTALVPGKILIFAPFNNGWTLSSSTFASTFQNCQGRGTLNKDLFKGIVGTAAASAFSSTFSGCTGLYGRIPADLFSGLSGTITTNAFVNTFLNCTNLGKNAVNGTSKYFIPPELFQNFSTSGTNLMTNIFKGTGLVTSCATPLDVYTTGFESYFTDGDNPSKVSCNFAYTFSVTTTPMLTASFSFSYALKGSLYVQWEEDGDIETISSDSTSVVTKTHSYLFKTATSVTIRFKSDITASSPYNTTNGSPTNGTAGVGSISFANNTYVQSVSGSLGALLPTISSAHPSFYGTFMGCTNLTTVPANLFQGLSGTVNMRANIFYRTFQGSGLTSVPSGLFNGIVKGSNYMFAETFGNCSGLTTVPANLFNTVATSGSYMFYQTFMGSGLTSVPAGLFNGLSTTPTSNMFYSTFKNCSGLESVPGTLFQRFTGAPSTYMFRETFAGTGLKSIPSNLFSYIGTTPSTYLFRGTFMGCTALGSDNNISNPVPANLFSQFNGKTPSTGMFYQTFEGCSNWRGTLPDLFGGLSGTTVNQYVFYRTFYGCSKLYGDLPNTFVGTSGSVASYTFYQTFYGCTNLGTGSSVNGYIPPAFFGGITPNVNATNPTFQMFTGTGLLTECPGVYNQYFTGFETFVDGSNSPKVSCKRCAYLPGQASYGNTCYDLCNLNGDNMTKLHVGDNWFHLFAQSEATNFTHHLNFKYGNNATDICFVPLNSGLDNANSGSLNFNDGGSQRYHAKRSGTTSRSGGEQSKTKSVATEPEQKTKQ